MATPNLDAFMNEIQMLKSNQKPPPPLDQAHRTFMAIDAFVAEMKLSGMSGMPVAQVFNDQFKMLAGGRPTDMGPQPLI